MNPNTTVSYMAAQAHQRQMERTAARGWMAEQAVRHGGVRRTAGADVLTRLMAAIFERPRRIVRNPTSLDAPSPSRYPSLDRAG